MIQKTRTILGVCFLLFAGFCVWQALPANVSQQAAMRPAAADSVAASLPKQITHTPIEQVRVGQRVLAHNPEVTDEQRSEFEKEPTFEHWVHLKLEMPKQDGGILHIELLRPLEWVASQLGYVVRQRDVETHDAESTQASNLPAGRFMQTSLPTPARTNESSHSSVSQSPSGPDLAKPSRLAAANHPDESQVPLSPLQPVFYRLAMTSAVLDAANADLVGLTVEMNLPELGASGTAIVTEVLGTTPIEPKAGPDDSRRVVTATFRHPPSNQILDVNFVSEADWQHRQSADPNAPHLKPETQNLNPVGEADTISVTDNHLFWSVDQQEFVEVGQMEIGEKIQTFYGETKRITSKLPRPGPPEEVFNLEVHDEHVYFAGEVLVHNDCLRDRVLANIAESRRARDASNFSTHRLRESAARQLANGADGGDLVTFFHGSNQAGASSLKGVGIQSTRFRPGSDFGPGFYLSENMDVAVTRAIQQHGDDAAIIAYRVPRGDLDGLSSLNFNAPTPAWQEFVLGNQLYEVPIIAGNRGVDLISGPMWRKLGQSGFGNSGTVIGHWPWPSQSQISIHSDRAIDLFNRSVVR